MILAIDLGNYSIKTSEGIIFTSTFEEGKSNNPIGETTLNYNEEYYTMYKGNFDNTYNKSEKNYIPNLLLAIYKSVPKDVHNLKLVLGTPVDNPGITLKFKEELLGKTFKWSVNNHERIVTIDKFATVGEGISAFYALDKDIRKQPVCILDIGGRTVNVAVFEKNKLQKKFTISKGMIDLYDIIAAKENTNGKRYKAEQIEDLLKRGVIKDVVEEEKSFINYILNEVSRKVDLDLYHNIYTGGGSKALEGHLRALGGTVMDNALFANCIGNKLIAKKQWEA